MKIHDTFIAGTNTFRISSYTTAPVVVEGMTTSFAVNDDYRLVIDSRANRYYLVNNSPTVQYSFEAVIVK